MSIRRTHPGRPRLVPSNTAAPPREQVLHAAAQLFVTKGFAATSTREIADKVGIRQASLYYRDDGSGSGAGVTRCITDAREGCLQVDLSTDAGVVAGRA